MGTGEALSCSVTHWGHEEASRIRYLSRGGAMRWRTRWCKQRDSAAEKQSKKVTHFCSAGWGKKEASQVRYLRWGGGGAVGEVMEEVVQVA